MDLRGKVKLLPLFVPLVILLFIGCDEPEEEDTTPPTVIITSPPDSSTVYEIVSITCISTDNEGVAKVELWIDMESAGVIDETKPYSLDWNTISYENRSYSITVLSYDLNDNEKYSDPITLTVDNSLSVPSAVNVISVVYTAAEMTVTWEESIDGDFKEYHLLYSEFENGDKDTLMTFTDKSIVSYIITDFDPTHENWFWIAVIDSSGQTSIGSGRTNECDPPPELSVFYEPEYYADSIIVKWSINNELDFQSYSLYAHSTNGIILVFSTNLNTDTSITLGGMENCLFYAYQLIVQDIWDSQSVSSIFEISSTPTFRHRSDYNFHISHYFGSSSSVVQTNDGSYVYIESMADYDLGGDRVRLNKIDQAGADIWSVNVGDDAIAGSGALKLTSDEGYILTYWVSGDMFPAYTSYVKKRNPEGSSIWSYRFSLSEGDFLYDVEGTLDGGYIAVGSTEVNDGGGDAVVVKLSSNGVSEWTNIIGEIGSTERAFSVVNTDDGGFIVAGEAYSDSSTVLMYGY